MDDEASLQPTIARARDVAPGAWQAPYRRRHPHAGRRSAAPMCDDGVSETFTRVMEAIGRFEDDREVLELRALGALLAERRR